MLNVCTCKNQLSLFPTKHTPLESPSTRRIYPPLCRFLPFIFSVHGRNPFGAPLRQGLAVSVGSSSFLSISRSADGIDVAVAWHAEMDCGLPSGKQARTHSQRIVRSRHRLPPIASLHPTSRYEIIQTFSVNHQSIDNTTPTTCCPYVCTTTAARARSISAWLLEAEPLKARSRIVGPTFSGARFL